MSQHFPFRLSPQGTDLSCWQWIRQPRPDPEYLLMDQNESGLARIRRRDHTWTADSLNEAYLWTRELDLDPETDTGPYFTDPWESSSVPQLKRQVERDLAYAAILYSAVPNPMTVPAFFVLGHTIPCSAFLQSLEILCRAQHGPAFVNGCLARLTHDPKDQPPPNPAIQARFLADTFQIQQAGWPPHVTRALDGAIWMHAEAVVTQVDIARTGAATPTSLARSTSPDPA